MWLQVKFANYPTVEWSPAEVRWDTKRFSRDRLRQKFIDPIEFMANWFANWGTCHRFDSQYCKWFARNSAKGCFIQIGSVSSGIAFTQSLCVNETVAHSSAYARRFGSVFSPTEWMDTGQFDRNIRLSDSGGEKDRIGSNTTWGDLNCYWH